MLVADGEVITQILAIVSCLDARFPQCNFLPREPLARTRALEMLAWMNNTVHPTFTHVFMPYKFAGNEPAQAEIKAFNTQLYASLLEELEAHAAAAAQQGRPYFGGAQFGPLDAYALTLLRWGGFAGHDPQGYSGLVGPGPAGRGAAGRGAGHRARAAAVERLQAAAGAPAAAQRLKRPGRHKLPARSSPRRRYRRPPRRGIRLRPAPRRP